MITYRVELYGGVDDGKVIDVHRDVIISRRLVLPRAPEFVFAEWNDPANECVTYTTEVWEWDGTVTESGTFRFRLAS